jgi:DNA topoisomerase-1
MSKTKILIIVESPGKIKKISQYLGEDYIVKASYGHVEDLDKSTLSVDVQNNFKPNYIITDDKKKVVKELRDLKKDCSDVILAADGDREGEAIAWSLANVLKLDNPKRIIFHEITKPALLKALENPTIINMNMVNAQQSRRILDRLVGYSISPVLWKYLSHEAKSAGRVQSVIVKIIVDKENEISKSISQSYFKTTAHFNFGTENIIQLTGVLHVAKKQDATSNKLYHFDSEESITTFLNLINNKTKFKIVSVDNKKGIRKPSPPFITSSLQQEASTKLRFNVKKTMDVAQKLYEAGLITYMRTDCPNMSKEAIDSAKQYIIDKYGNEYSDSKNYQSKNGLTQDAHECIRPTHMDKPDIENSNNDLKKLYSLIWKRAIASQMSNAKINIQTILTDSINNKSSILIFNNNQTYFTSNLENIEFPGYLIVYDNSQTNDEIIKGELKIKVGDIFFMHKIITSEEYTQPPMRYNEAALVKYMEKNGIGRPSTYASNISKVIERQYVEIKDIEGVNKKSKQFELNSKYNIKTTVKDIFVGKEAKKIVPTVMGIHVNEFMNTHFETIMNIDFTANFETYLDKISTGDANWITVLRLFYDMFNPIVQKLIAEAPSIKKDSNTDRLVGTTESGQEIFTGTGKYGPYVKMNISDNDKIKWRYAKLKDMTIDKVSLEHAITLLEWPKTIGKIGNSIITLHDGEFGLYIKCGKQNYSIKDEIEPDDIDITYAKKLIDSGDPYALKTFKMKDQIINIKKGEFGNYIQIVKGSNKRNVSIPAKVNIETITIEQILEIIMNKKPINKKYKSY